MYSLFPHVKFDFFSLERKKPHIVSEIAVTIIDSTKKLLFILLLLLLLYEIIVFFISLPESLLLH